MGRWRRCSSVPVPLHFCSGHERDPDQQETKNGARCALYRQSGSDRLPTAHFETQRHHHYTRDGALLGRLGAGATLKAALAKVQVNVIFGHVGQTGICICRGDGTAR
jgi:hypothetical protein